jgi:hypothetical protein
MGTKTKINEDYNGWKNRVTWLVNLHYGNYFQDIIKDWDPSDISEESVADFMSEFITEIIEEAVSSAGNNGFIRDMLFGKLSDISFNELAKSYIEDVVIEENFKSFKEFINE